MVVVVVVQVTGGRSGMSAWSSVRVSCCSTPQAHHGVVHEEKLLQLRGPQFRIWKVALYSFTEHGVRLHCDASHCKARKGA